MTFTLDNKLYRTNPEGYLVDAGDWNSTFAEFMATQDKIVLTRNHWAVIYLIRDYHDDHGVAPGIRLLVKQMGNKLGKDKSSSRYLYELFPEGPAKQACRYAGLSKPTGCI